MIYDTAVTITKIDDGRQNRIYIIIINIAAFNILII
jgi:hypothetical protein